MTPDEILSYGWWLVPLIFIELAFYVLLGKGILHLIRKKSKP